jgi:hypothetical protein
MVPAAVVKSMTNRPGDPTTPPKRSKKDARNALLTARMLAARQFGGQRFGGYGIFDRLFGGGRGGCACGHCGDDDYGYSDDDGYF